MKNNNKHWSNWQDNWWPVTNHEAHQITGSTSYPGTVYAHPINNLPSSIAGQGKMQGIYAAYTSGYYEAYLSPEGVVVGGEIVVAREDSGKGKGYVWLFGVSGSGVYCSGPYKPYDGHHFGTGSGISLTKLFGKIPPPSEEGSK